jgi:mono/diheme cytochrome c family protein
MLIRAVREGISHDGRVLTKAMRYESFRYLPDEDVEAVVAYLRTLKPIRHPLPRTVVPADRAKDLKVPAPITAPVPVDSPADAVERGRRLARVADCIGCHSSWYTPKLPGIFGGGNLVKGGGLTAYSANITSDDSGIAHYDAAFFREVMRTGRAKGRDLSPLMPWTVFGHLNDADLDALFAYLRALPKVKHVIDNIDPPTFCKNCEGTHPLGQYNRPYEPHVVPVRVSDLQDTVGTYRFEDGSLMRILIENGRLMKVEKRACELLTEDRLGYFCENSADRIVFVRDAAGKVTGLTFSLDPGVKIR